MLKTMMFMCAMAVSAFTAEYCTLYQEQYRSKKFRTYLVSEYKPVNIDEWLGDTSDSEKEVNVLICYSFKEIESGQQERVMHIFISDCDDKRHEKIEKINTQRDRAENIFECYISGIDESSAYTLAWNMLLGKPTPGVMIDTSLSNFRFARVKGSNRVTITEYEIAASGEKIFKEQTYVSISNENVIVFDIKKCAEVISGRRLRINKCHYRALLTYLKYEINKKYDWRAIRRENETKRLVRESQLGDAYFISFQQSLLDPLDPYFDLWRSAIGSWKGIDHMELTD